MPAVYDKMGIRFVYPENWELDEEEALHGNQSVTVSSPGGAFWSITLHSPNTDPGELATAALEALKSEYAQAESEPVSEVLGGKPVSGFDLNFFYLDFTNTAWIRAFLIPTASCLVLCQAEDRDFDKLEQVFRAITTSLISGG